jgi:cardiolipin synthase
MPVQKENIYTWPNAISVGRAAASPYLAYLITHGQHDLALKLLFVAGISDLVDGWIARQWVSQRSVFGTALDPFCDKILMTTVVAAEGAAGLLPVPLAALIIGRDVALTIGGFVYRYRSLDPPVCIRLCPPRRAAQSRGLGTHLSLPCLAGNGRQVL